MSRRGETGAQVVRVAGAGRAPARAVRPVGRSSDRRWLRREVSLAGLAIALVIVAGVAYLGMAAKGHAVAQAKQAEQERYSRTAVQYNEVAPAPGQPPLDQEYPEDEQPTRAKE